MRFHEIVPIFNLLVGRRLDVALFGRPVEGGEEASMPRTFLLHGQELAQIRKRWKSSEEPLASTVNKFLRYADKLLPLPLLSVTDKAYAPEGGSTNDYMSLARYWWPNPATDDGLPYVLRDGEINPDVYSDDFDLTRFEEFTHRAFVLAFAFSLSADEAYAERCAELIRHWCLNPESCQSPNFEYAQIRRGHRRGGGVGIIEAHRLIYVVEAAQMIAGSPHWPESSAIELKGWFSALLTWLRTSRAGLSAAQRKNNIGVWYDVQCAVYALYIGDRELAAIIVQDSSLRRLDVQMGAGGAFPAELARTRPYDYFAFNLLAYIALARVGESVDVDLWARELPDGRNLEGAVQWLRNIVQPETLAFQAGLLAGEFASSDEESDSERVSESRDRLIAALRAEVETLRWKIRAAAADRGELVGALQERANQTERLVALVASLGASDGASVDGTSGANVAGEVEGESMDERVLTQAREVADAAALCARIQRLQDELGLERRERKGDAAAIHDLERRLREQTELAELRSLAMADLSARHAEAEMLADGRLTELGKAMRKVTAMEAAIERMVRVRQESEGRIRDRFEFLLQDHEAKVNKKISVLQAKRRADSAALAKTVAREESARLAVRSLEETLVRQEADAARSFLKAELKEKRKRRALQAREQQSLAALQHAAAERDQSAANVVRLQAELAKLRRPVIARVKGRLTGNRQKIQRHKEASAIEASGILRVLESTGASRVGSDALLSSSPESLEGVIPLFATNWYVARYPGVLLNWDSALAEHLAEGGQAGRRPHPLFWSAWYAKRYLTSQPGICPLVHFLQNGNKEDLDPNPYFDSSWYRKTHLKSQGGKMLPLLHYITEGRAQAFLTSRRVDLALVREHYAEARMPGGDPLAVLLELPPEAREKYKVSRTAGLR